MAKRKEVINGLHNVFTLNADDLYDISSFSYEQSVDENTILFAIADSEDIGKYITINGGPKIISENDNFIITDGIVFSGNGGGSGNSGGSDDSSGDNNDGGSEDKYMRCDGSNYTGSSNLVNHSISTQWTIKKQDGTVVDNQQDKMSIEVENGAKVDFYGEWSYKAETATTKKPTACSGNWGDALPSPGNVVSFSESNIEETTSFSQTISGPKSGLEVKNGKVVVASGSDTDTKTASVTFKHRIYYGASTLSSISSLEDLKEELNTELSDTFAKTFTANCTGGKYIYLAYPSEISGTPVFNVGGFDSSEIIESNPTITNDVEYVGGTNIDITDNTISAKGYTYNDDKNFYIGNEATYTEITDLTWDNTTPDGEDEPVIQTIHYNGEDSNFDFNSIVKTGDSIRFYDIDNDASFVFKVTSVNNKEFNINGFCRIHPDYTKVQRIDDGVTFLAKNDGDVYVKGIGNYNGADTNTDTCNSLQDAFNEMNSNLEELSNSVNSTAYKGSDTISISVSGIIGAKGYSYTNNVIALSNTEMSNGTTFHFKEGTNLTSSYSNFNIVDTPIKISNTNSPSNINLNGVPVTSDSNILTTGSISASEGFYETSDIRKKNVIDELPLDKAYELINNCQSIIYTLKDNTDKQQIGLIAQEVQQYFPEVVSENEDGYLSLDYAKLTAIIFRVLKDVIDRLNRLENK